MNLPCGLTYETIDRRNRLDDDLRCTAEFADGSGNICNRPLGAHPREQSSGNIISIYFIKWN